MNYLDTMKAAISQGKVAQTAADICANDMAMLLAGRLRGVRPYVLAKLKRELRSFNICTREWKD